MFQEVWIQAGDATDGAETSEDLQNRENEMREVVKAATDDALDNAISGQISQMTQKEIEAVQLQAVKVTLEHWDGADD